MRTSNVLIGYYNVKEVAEGELEERSEYNTDKLQYAGNNECIDLGNVMSKEATEATKATDRNASRSSEQNQKEETSTSEVR